jgi:hypothetical protein
MLLSLPILAGIGIFLQVTRDLKKSLFTKYGFLATAKQIKQFLIFL